MSFGFEFVFPASGFEFVLFWLLVIGLATILISDFTFLPLALIHDRLQENYPDPVESPLVTVIVPAHNEEQNIGSLLYTLLDQSYSNLEILVVNDGSTDNTAQIVKDYRRRGVQLLDLPRPNSGKHAALNYGLTIANGEIVVFMDSDGLVERTCITRMVAAMQNPHVYAVAGNVKVANRVSLFTKVQALEYIRDINVPRRAFDLLDISIVIPGPLGAFRKEYLRTVGSYDPDTVAEDFDTTVKVNKARDGMLVGIRNVTDAIAYTEAPERIRDLIKQRKRWYGGMTQTVIKHSDRRFVAHAGAYSTVAVPYIYLTLFAVPLLELVMTSIGLVLSVVTGFVWYIVAFIIYSLLETLTSLLALRLDKEDLRLLIYSPLFVLGYRQFLDLIRIYAFYEIFRGQMKWSRSERYGGMREKTKSAIIQPRTND
ncbi:MAG TPA: glycosyltransferase [Candidatus Bathyarchaeia archaeon]|nr:glycosyltransferase [Candidatus Bathyarchaeia archaeon]